MATPGDKTAAMTARLILICHASTDAVRGAAFPRDEPLDDRGRTLAVELGGHLPSVDRCWTSPELRTRQTADALRLNASVEPALHECDYGGGPASRWPISRAGARRSQFLAARSRGSAARRRGYCRTDQAGGALACRRTSAGSTGHRRHPFNDYPRGHRSRDASASAVVLASRYRTTDGHAFERHRWALEYRFQRMRAVSREHEDDDPATHVSARTLYDYYLIELQHSVRGWRVVKIAHCLLETKSFSPVPVYHRDRVAAEAGGRALIDARFLKGRRFKKGQSPALSLQRERNRLGTQSCLPTWVIRDRVRTSRKSGHVRGAPKAEVNLGRGLISVQPYPD